MFGRKGGGQVATPEGTKGYNYETVMIHKEGSANDIFEELNEQIRNRPGVRLAHTIPIALFDKPEKAGNTSAVILVFETVE